MTKATDIKPNPRDRKDAARQAGFDARERGEKDTGWLGYTSETEKNAWLAGYHDSMALWHRARAGERESAVQKEAHREGELFIYGQDCFESGMTRDATIDGCEDPSEWTIVGEGWDYAQHESKS